MALEDYTVLATVFGNMVNRDLVEKAAIEGRTVPPLVAYVPAGRASSSTRHPRRRSAR